MKMDRFLIGTIGGPKSKSAQPAVIRAMDQYFTGYRMNGSHLHDVETLRALAQMIHEAAPDSILAYDTCGPEKRVGHIPGGHVKLEQEQIVEVGEGAFLPAGGPGQHLHIELTDQQLLAEPQPGQYFIMNDGQVKAEILMRTSSGYLCRIVAPGILPSRKNIMCPDVHLLGSVIAPKEEAYLEIIDKEMPWVTDVYVSFTQCASDLDEVRSRFHRSMRITSKPETCYAIKNLGEIVLASDVVMVPQGDLFQAYGRRLPQITDRIIRACVRGLKPCIAATGLFRSMIYEPKLPQGLMYLVWILLMQGVAGFMVSDETAAGEYPVEVGRELWKTMQAYDEFGGFQ